MIRTHSTRPFSLFRKLREQSWLPACVTRCVNCVDDTVVDAAFLPRLDVHRRALRLQLCSNGVYRDYFLCERSLLFVPEWFAPLRTALAAVFHARVLVCATHARGPGFVPRPAVVSFFLVQKLIDETRGKELEAMQG